MVRQTWELYQMLLLIWHQLFVFVFIWDGGEVRTGGVDISETNFYLLYGGSGCWGK